MPGRNPRFEIYFAKRATWKQEFAALREILLACGLDEELKWRQACYCFEGGNVVLLAGFKEFCALSFFKGVLLPDPEGILVAPGANSLSVRMIKFTSLEGIVSRKVVLKNYIRAAIKVEQSGAKVDFSANKIVARPAELEAALAKDNNYREAFEALTPGRQRSWIIHIESAKQEKTKFERVSKAREKVIKGLGMLDLPKR
jgi:uncharacterized protein YdeI (YjbR/CyaY-like superfamily)